MLHVVVAGAYEGVGIIILRGGARFAGLVVPGKVRQGTAGRQGGLFLGRRSRRSGCLGRRLADFATRFPCFTRLAGIVVVHQLALGTVTAALTAVTVAITIASATTAAALAVITVTSFAAAAFGALRAITAIGTFCALRTVATAFLAITVTPATTAAATAAFAALRAITAIGTFCTLRTVAATFLAATAVAIQGLVKLDGLQAELGGHFLDNGLLEQVVDGFDFGREIQSHDQGGGHEGQNEIGQGGFHAEGSWFYVFRFRAGARASLKGGDCGRCTGVAS